MYEYIYIYIYISHSLSLSLSLSIYLSIHPSIHPSIYLSLYIYIYIPKPIDSKPKPKTQNPLDKARHVKIKGLLPCQLFGGGGGLKGGFKGFGV